MGSSPNSSQIYFSKDHINEVTKQREEQRKLLLLKKKTPDKPNFKDEDNIWEALFPGFKRLNKDEKNKFKNAIAKMNKDSWKFWMEPLAALGGKSRVQSYTFPMNCSQHGETSFNFGEFRKGYKNEKTGVKKPDRSHAGIDIYGKGGKGDAKKGIRGKEGHEITACTKGTVVSVKNYHIGTKIATVVNDDGSIINYSEINESVKAGDVLYPGQKVGTTKTMKVDSMLHIEVYAGKTSDLEAAEKARKTGSENDIVATGSINSSNMQNVNGNKTRNLSFDRRTDLHDPSIFGVLACAKQEVSDK